MTAFAVVRGCSGHCRTFLKPKFRPVVIQTATKINLFDIDKKSGYNVGGSKSTKDVVVHTMNSMKDEMKLYKGEVEDRLNLRHLDRWHHHHGSYEYMWKFAGEESLKDWVVTSDHDNLQGKSSVNLTLSKNNKALFHGHLCQEIPKDGVSKNAGYCNIRSPSKFISFKRQCSLEWLGYTHLVMRVRGDGRPYYLNLMMERMFDIGWCDQYNYTLYTKGGPYWQIAKIPFSKFFFTHKGRTQDKQLGPDLHKVNNLGITMADGVEGPFQLEIDYIAVMKDFNHKERTAYEMYHAEYTVS